jgi:integrase
LRRCSAKTSNPFDGLSHKGPGRRNVTPLTIAQVEELALVAENTHGIGAFVRYCAYSGMRIGEVFGLEWRDLDFDRMRIMVRRRVYRGDVDLPKGGREREIVLFPEARDALLNLPREGDRIFRAKRGGNLTHSVLAYYWQAITAVFGPVDPHELRHFAGHYLYVTLGLPARVVAVQLGHSSPRLVEDLYGHGDVGALEEIDRAIGANVVPLRRASGG